MSMKLIFTYVAIKKGISAFKNWGMNVLTIINRKNLYRYMWLTSWNWLQVSRLRFSHHSNEICHSCFVLLSFQFTIVSGFKSDTLTFQFSLFSSVPLGIAVFFTIYNLQCSCQFMISVPRKWQSIIKVTEE